MRINFLGTGTSTGTPAVGCHCDVCRSTDSRDIRMRTSALVTTDAGRNLLIDCGPDFREQLLRLDSPPIDALLLTHIHFDHVGGIEDLRPYCYGRPGGKGFPIYCEKVIDDELHRRLPYCFAENPYPGAPRFDMHMLTPGVSTEIGGAEVTPLRVMHTPQLPITAFRIDRLGYVTDCKVMPQATIEALKGVDTLVINALRITEHPSHMNLSQALDVIKEISPRKAFLIHLSHDMGFHAVVEPTLPENVRIATDGLTVDF